MQRQVIDKNDENGRVAARHSVRMEEVRFPPLPRQKFAVIYADPPWDYKGQLQHAGAGNGDSGGAVRHYGTVKTRNLMQLPIADIAEQNCLLFMWATSPHLDQAIDLGKAWGFAWATIAFVWQKGKPNPGFYTMSENELCLVFKKGKIPQPRGARNIRQTIQKLREKHSRKPEEVRQRIVDMFPVQKKIELFARQRVAGWEAWGLEAVGLEAVGLEAVGLEAGGLEAGGLEAADRETTSPKIQLVKK